MLSLLIFMEKEEFIDEPLNEYIIPDNYKPRNRSRNIIEAIIVVGGLSYLIWHSPFILNVRLIAIMCVVLFLGLLFVVGIKNESVTQFLINYILFLKRRNKYYFRKPSITKNTKSDKKYIQDFIGVKNIEGGVIETSDGKYIHICEVVPVNYELRTNSERNAIIEQFEAFLKQAPGKIRFKSVTMPMDSSVVVRNIERKIREEKSATLRQKMKDYISFLKKLSVKDSLTRRFFLILEYKTDVDGETISKNIEDIHKALYQIRYMAEMYFDKMGNTIIQHENESTFQAEILYLLLNRRSSINIPFEDNFTRVVMDHRMIRGLNVLGDDEMDIDINDYFCSKGLDTTHTDYVINDGLYTTYIYLTDKGYKIRNYGAWIENITQLGSGVDVDVFALMENRDKIIDSLGRTIRLSTSTAKDKYEVGGLDGYEEAVSRVNTSNFIRDKMKNDGDDFYNVFVLITIMDKTLRGMKDKKVLVQKHLKSRDYYTDDTFGRCDEAFKMALPLGYESKMLFEKGRRNMLTSSLASLYMFTAFESFDESGFLMGQNTLNSSLVVLNNFNTNIYKNGNMVLLGTAGAGKTFTEQLLGRRMRLSGIRVMYILPIKGHEYYKGCMDIGGSFIKVCPNSKDCINIMEIRVVDDIDNSLIEVETFNKECLLTKKINQVITFIQLLLRDEKMTNIEESLLDQILSSIYEAKGITRDNESIWADKDAKILKPMPIISDLYDALLGVPELKNIRTILTPFISGTARNMNGQTNVDLNNKYIVFDISETSENYLPAFMFIALDCAYDIIKENRLVNDALFIDECWKLLINPYAAKFVLEIVKIVRGYGGASIIASQDLNDFMGLGNGQYCKGIISNSKIKILLQLEDDEADSVQKLLKLTASEKKLIKKFERGRCLMIANGDKIPVYINASIEEEKLFTTDSKRLREIVSMERQKSN